MADADLRVNDTEVKIQSENGINVSTSTNEHNESVNNTECELAALNMHRKHTQTDPEPDFTDIVIKLISTVDSLEVRIARLENDRSDDTSSQFSTDSIDTLAKPIPSPITPAPVYNINYEDDEFILVKNGIPTKHANPPVNKLPLKNRFDILSPSDDNWGELPPEKEHFTPLPSDRANTVQTRSRRPNVCYTENYVNKMEHKQYQKQWVNPYEQIQHHHYNGESSAALHTNENRAGSCKSRSDTAELTLVGSDSMTNGIRVNGINNLLIAVDLLIAVIYSNIIQLQPPINSKMI